MKVLIACEQSGSVRDQFIALGHEAMSADLKPTMSPGPHYQGSVFDLCIKDFDLVIAFPPCTYLAKAQMFRYKTEPGRIEKRDKAVQFVRNLWEAADTIAIENPTGFLSSGWRPYSQLVHPWWFGDPYRKEICLWLKNVPPLIATCYNPIRKHVVNHTNGRMSQVEKSEIKSSWKYYPGLSAALAYQWGNIK